MNKIFQQLSKTMYNSGYRSFKNVFVESKEKFVYKWFVFLENYGNHVSDDCEKVQLNVRV